MRQILVFAAIITVVSAQATSTAVLTTIAEAKRMNDDECRQPRQFQFTGQVLSTGVRNWIIRDETDGTAVFASHAELPDVPVGTLVRLDGTMILTKDGGHKFFADSMRAIGHGPPLPTVDTTGADIRSGRYDFQFVRVKGVLASVVRDEVDTSCCWAVLRTSTGSVFLTLFGEWNDPKRITPFINADVEATGLASPIAGLRHSLGRRISIGRHGTIRILSPAPTDPFAAPGLMDTTVLHRQRASGRILAYGRGRFFIRSFANRILPVIPADGEHVPDPGAVVTVVGFAEADPYRLYLTEALVRQDAPPHTAADERPVSRPLESLFKDDENREKLDMSANGALIALRGTSTRTEDNALLLSSGGFSVLVDLSAIRSHMKEIPADGSVVEAIGLSLAEFESQPQVGVYPAFRRFVLYPRTEADIRILSRPPWWTPIRLLCVIAALGLILVAILVWTRMIQVVSERRGRALYDEKIDHALAEQKIEERTRLAVELHDSVSQTLTGVALQLDGGEIETAKTMLASCRGELRRCLWDLRSRTFEEKDMTEAIERTITPYLNGIEATVRFNVPRERLSESVTHAILRIIRELVVNAIRHGQAQHIKIAGEMHGTTISFSVRDDGCGFDPGTAAGPSQGHFGLLGIRERIEDFNGSLTIDSSVGHGAKFTVTLKTDDATNE